MRVYWDKLAEEPIRILFLSHLQQSFHQLLNGSCSTLPGAAVAGLLVLVVTVILVPMVDTRAVRMRKES